MCPLSHPTPAILSCKESAVAEGSTPDDAETDTPALVDEGDQHPATESVAAAPTPYSPESPSGEDGVVARAIEAVADTATVVESTDTVGEVAVAVELDEAATGECVSDLGLHEESEEKPSALDTWIHNRK